MYSCCYVSSIFTADKCNLNITLNNSLTPSIENSSVSHIDFNLKRFQLKKTDQCFAFKTQKSLALFPFERNGRQINI